MAQLVGEATRDELTLNSNLIALSKEELPSFEEFMEAAVAYHQAMTNLKNIWLKLPDRTALTAPGTLERELNSLTLPFSGDPLDRGSAPPLVRMLNAWRTRTELRWLENDPRLAPLAWL